jgi:hypothetical protein
VNEGSLVKLLSGEYGTIVREPYPFCFTNTQTDRDLVEGGMGHLAGSYGSAIDIMHHKTGLRRRHSLASNSFEVIND